MHAEKKSFPARKRPSKTAKRGKARLHLKRGVPIGEELKIIARLQLETALVELAGNNVSPEPIHEARTAIKKVRAVVQLASPALGSVRRDFITDRLHEA